MLLEVVQYIVYYAIFRPSHDVVILTAFSQVNFGAIVRLSFI